MMNLIDELKVIPGVTGACIFNSQEGLKVTNLPAIFKPDRLNIVGRHLAKLYSAGRMSFDDLTDITLHYDESVIIARELEKNTLVFAICDPSFNHNLLTMSFNLLQEEFKNGSFSSGPASDGAAQPSEAKAPSSGSDTSGHLKNLLEEMKASLAKVLGPMAEFVFDEVAEEWMEQGPADFSRIEDLIEKINQEIGDQGKVDDYRLQISPLLKDFQRG